MSPLFQVGALRRAWPGLHVVGEEDEDDDEDGADDGGAAAADASPPLRTDLCAIAADAADARLPFRDITVRGVEIRGGRRDEDAGVLQPPSRRFAARCSTAAASLLPSSFVLVELGCVMPHLADRFFPPSTQPRSRG